MDGKSWGLLAVLREHRGAVEYDFRTRFGEGLQVIGNGMSLAEAARHIERFRSDPSSALAADLEGWAFAVSREALALYDIFDVTVLAHSDSKKRRPKPHAGRPFTQVGERTRHGDAKGLDQAEVRARLAAMAGRPEPPV